MFNVDDQAFDKVARSGSVSTLAKSEMPGPKQTKSVANTIFQALLPILDLSFWSWMRWASWWTELSTSTAYAMPRKRRPQMPEPNWLLKGFPRLTILSKMPSDLGLEEENCSSYHRGCSSSCPSRRESYVLNGRCSVINTDKSSECTSAAAANRSRHTAMKVSIRQKSC